MAAPGPGKSDLTSMVEKVALLGLLGAMVGAGVGAITGTVQRQRKKAAEARASVAMPPIVAAVPQLADPLVQLAAQVNSFHEQSFRDLCRKLHAMLLALHWLEEAPGEAIQHAHKHLGTEFAAGVFKYLIIFYNQSGVVTKKSAVGPEKWATALVPVRKDLLETHELLTSVVEGLGQAMDSVAATKIISHLTEKH